MPELPLSGMLLAPDPDKPKAKSQLLKLPNKAALPLQINNEFSFQLVFTVRISSTALLTLKVRALSLPAPY